MSSVKSRHYTHLASRLRNLTTHLGQTERLMDELSGHLESMQRIGINTSSQFMAAGRLVDIELHTEQNKMDEAEQHGSAGSDEEDREDTPTARR